jgi:arylformamidase
MAHWPGEIPVDVRRTMDMEQGAANNLTEISLSVHSATHMDAPSHFVRGGTTIDYIPLDAVTGPARVIEIGDTESIKPTELEKNRIRPGERILFKTGNSATAWNTGRFVEDFIYVSVEAARFLAERGVMLVGVDYLSVGSYHGGGPQVHQALLGGGVWIIEGLDLSAVSAGNYELVCLPLKIADAEGAPARAIVRPLRG